MPVEDAIRFAITAGMSVKGKSNGVPLANGQNVLS